MVNQFTGKAPVFPDARHPGCCSARWRNGEIIDKRCGTQTKFTALAEFVRCRHTLMSLSLEPVANHSLPGSTATQRTQPKWLEMTRYSFQGGCHFGFGIVGVFLGAINCVPGPGWGWEASTNWFEMWPGSYDTDTSPWVVPSVRR